MSNKDNGGESKMFKKNSEINMLQMFTVNVPLMFRIKAKILIKVAFVKKNFQCPEKKQKARVK
jgi:hypothetical protein